MHYWSLHVARRQVEEKPPCPWNYPNPVQSMELPSAEFIFGSYRRNARNSRERSSESSHDDLPVLIEGESGTGKEVIGRFLHKVFGLRREGPFLKLNCAASSAKLVGRRNLRVRKRRNLASRSDAKRFYWPGVGWDALSWMRLVSLDLLIAAATWRRRRFSGQLPANRVAAKPGALNARFVFASSARPRRGREAAALLKSCCSPLLTIASAAPLRERKAGYPSTLRVSAG